MSAVFQLDEPGVFLVFRSKEKVRDLVPVADATLLRTAFAAETDARMPAPGYHPTTRAVAPLPIARLVAEPGAGEVFAPPLARLPTRFARPTALPRTVTVHATILALLCTRRTVPGAGLGAPVPTHNRPSAVRPTWDVEPPLETRSTVPRTRMLAVKQLGTALATPNIPRLSLVAPNGSRVSTWECFFHQHHALSRVIFTTLIPTQVPAAKTMIAIRLTFEIH